MVVIRRKPIVVSVWWISPNIVLSLIIKLTLRSCKIHCPVLTSRIFISSFLLPSATPSPQYLSQPFSLSTLSDSPSTLSLCPSLHCYLSLSPYHSIPTSFTISSLSLFICLSTSSSISCAGNLPAGQPIRRQGKGQDASGSPKSVCFGKEWGVMDVSWIKEANPLSD